MQILDSSSISNPEAELLREYDRTLVALRSASEDLTREQGEIALEQHIRAMRNLREFLHNRVLPAEVRLAFSSNLPAIVVVERP